MRSAEIQYAQLCINENPGCEFIATNLDAVTHLTDAQEWAGNGAMAGAIKGCTGREPTLVGKPSPLMIDYIVEKYGWCAPASPVGLCACGGSRLALRAERPLGLCPGRRRAAAVGTGRLP